MNGFEKRTQEKKNIILEAVVELYCERGMEKVSISDIAEKAGVSQVSIYNYFQSKDNLACCAVTFYYEKLLQDFMEAMHSELSFKEKVKQAFFEPMKKKSTSLTVFWDSLISSKYREIALDYEKKLVPHMLSFIKEGIEQGYFNKRYSKEALLFYLSIYGEGAMNKLEAISDSQAKAKLYNELLDLFLYGVSGCEPEKVP